MWYEWNLHTQDHLFLLEYVNKNQFLTNSCDLHKKRLPQLPYTFPRKRNADRGRRLFVLVLLYCDWLLPAYLLLWKQFFFFILKFLNSSFWPFSASQNVDMHVWWRNKQAWWESSIIHLLILLPLFSFFTRGFQSIFKYNWSGSHCSRAKFSSHVKWSWVFSCSFFGDSVWSGRCFLLGQKKEKTFNMVDKSSYLMLVVWEVCLVV